MKRKMTKKESGKIGGTNRWAKISKKERSRIMSETAKQLWKKIRSGGFANK